MQRLILYSSFKTCYLISRYYYYAKDIGSSSQTSNGSCSLKESILTSLLCINHDGECKLLIETTMSEDWLG